VGSGHLLPDLDPVPDPRIRKFTHQLFTFLWLQVLRIPRNKIYFNYFNFQFINKFLVGKYRLGSGSRAGFRQKSFGSAAQLYFLIVYFTYSRILYAFCTHNGLKWWWQWQVLWLKDKTYNTRQKHCTVHVIMWPFSVAGFLRGVIILV
jgi:hypothetical protein